MRWRKWVCPECGLATYQPMKSDPKEVWCVRQSRHKRGRNRRMTLVEEKENE